MKRYTNPNPKESTMKSSTDEVKALVRFELPAIFKDNRIPLTVITDQHGNPWWVANEVCEVLGFSRGRDALRMVDKEDKRLESFKSALCTTLNIPPRGLLLVNESGLYQIIFQSNKPEAKAFKRWVTHEVLPTIRKTGSYNAKTASAPELASVEAVRSLLAEYDKKVAQVTELQTEK